MRTASSLVSRAFLNRARSLCPNPRPRSRSTLGDNTIVLRNVSSVLYTSSPRKPPYPGRPFPFPALTPGDRQPTDRPGHRDRQRARLICAMAAEPGKGSSSPLGGESQTAAASVVESMVNASQQQAPAVGDPEGGHAQQSAQVKTAAQLGFQIKGEEERYSRWLTLYDRTIQFPAHGSHPEQEHGFDIVGHPRAAFTFVVVFPFHPRPDGGSGGEVTLLREYSQGVNEMMYVLPTGAFDPQRHVSPVAAGRAELSEEARLEGGQWVALLPEHHPGVPEVKWCRNRMLPYLCIGPTVDVAPGEREPEEFIEIARVSIPELKRLMRSGEMMLPSVSTCAFALDELRERGLI